jgi:hypothetical protein
MNWKPIGYYPAPGTEARKRLDDAAEEEGDNLLRELLAAMRQLGYNDPDAIWPNLKKIMQGMGYSTKQWTVLEFDQVIEILKNRVRELELINNAFPGVGIGIIESVRRLGLRGRKRGVRIDGSELCRIRCALQLSQEAFAEKLEVAPISIRRWEDSSRCSAKTLKKIADKITMLTPGPVTASDLLMTDQN